MTERLRIAVLGTMGADPFAGMAWMHMQIAAGLLRLGHDVRYVETTSAWPYDVEQGTRIDDLAYTLAYMGRVTPRFGMGQRWAIRRSWGDGAWVGPAAADAAAWLAGTDLVFNIAGATQVSHDGFECGTLVHFGTDPVTDELRFAVGNERTVEHVLAHQSSVSYGENLGTPRSTLAPLPHLKARLRQPVLMDLWANAGAPPGSVFTTVGNWRQDGKDEVFQGAPLRWSKHHEFLKFIDVPRQAGQVVELATNLNDPGRQEDAAASDDLEPHQIRGARSLDHQHAQLLKQGGWRLANGPALSTDPFTYRDYLLASRAEFTVAREFNVLPRTAWFSERSACYLAAGRPVVTQDTGFSDVLPTGEGLFAFSTAEEAVEAIRAINADYERHARAAQAIAHEWFRAEKVLAQMLRELGA
jgi:hypothetical protein